MASISSGGMHALLTSLLLRSGSDDELTRGQKDVIDSMIHLIRKTLDKIDRVMIDGKVEAHEADPLKKNLQRLNKQVSLLSGSKGVGDATRNRLEAVSSTTKKMIQKIDNAQQAGAFEQDDGANDSASAIAGAMGAGGIGGIESAIPDAVQGAGNVDTDSSSGNSSRDAIAGLASLKGAMSSGSGELSSVAGTMEGLAKLTGGEDGQKMAKVAQEMEKLASKLDEAVSTLGVDALKGTEEAGVQEQTDTKADVAADLKIQETAKSDSDLANSQKALRPNDRIEDVQAELQDFSHDLDGIVNTLSGIEKLSGQNEKVQLQQMVQRIQKTQSVVLEAAGRLKALDPRQASGKADGAIGADQLQSLRPLDIVHQIEKLGNIESDAAGTLDLTHADRDSGFAETEFLSAADTFETAASTLDGMAGLLGADGGEAIGELSELLRGLVQTLENSSLAEALPDEGYEDGGLDSIGSGADGEAVLGFEVADFVDEALYISSTLKEFGGFAGGEIGLQMGRMSKSLETSVERIKNGVSAAGISAEIGSGS